MTELKQELQAPFVHMNGTSREELTEQLQNAYLAIGEAYKVLKQAAPHGRDYYPYNDGNLSFNRARDQHFDRLQKLQDVQDELEGVAGKILNTY